MLNPSAIALGFLHFTRSVGFERRTEGSPGRSHPIELEFELVENEQLYRGELTPSPRKSDEIKNIPLGIFFIPFAIFPL